MPLTVEYSSSYLPKWDLTKLRGNVNEKIGDH